MDVIIHDKLLSQETMSESKGGEISHQYLMRVKQGIVSNVT